MKANYVSVTKDMKMLYVRFVVAKGPYVAMTCDHHTANPMTFAKGMFSAIPIKLRKEWGVKIEVRETSDFNKIGRLVRKFC